MDRAPHGQTQSRRRAGRLAAIALSAAAHAGLIVALLLSWRIAPAVIAPAAIPVSLAPALGPPLAPPGPRAPALAPPRPAAAHAAPAKPPPPLAARPSPAPPAPGSLPATATPAAASGAGAGLSEAELAGAASADGGRGSGGGECDMARRVQAALRKDPLARAAVHAASGRAVMVWNGDWVQASAEDGKGLAAVREAISFEVAFAPPACRQARVRGLVLLSLNDGSPPLAVGADEWRWSDLLGLR
jgi:hypothetical protein